MTKKELGVFGEDYACDYLKSKGFVIVERNLHSRFGEIDIIARNDEFIVFAEVKLRAKGSMVSGLEAVTRSKMRKIFITASLWLSEHPSKLQPRFDVIEIVTETAYEPVVADLIHIENAFGSEVYNGSYQ